jgi:MFS family permease
MLGGTMAAVALCALGLPAGASSRDAGVEKRRILEFGVVVVLFAFALFALAIGISWAFAERIARQAGVDPNGLGLWFFLSSIVGMVGPAMTAWFGTRYGRTWPMAIGTVLTGGACFAFIMSDGFWFFGICLLLVWIASQYAFPFYFGLSAVMDPGGRVITAAMTTMLLMSAAAPAVGGYVLEVAGYKAMGWLMLLLSVAAAFIVVPIARKYEAAR